MNGRKLLPGKPLPATEIPDYGIARDTLDEHLSLRFARRLDRLNAIIKSCGERLEGNIFYSDGEVDFAGRPPTPELAPARRNVWRACRFKERMLEVGVNAGHSALLALSANPRLQYNGVDLAEHAYTVPCVDYLKGEFPGRIHLFPGDSREVLPWLADRNETDFDLIAIDGGHTSEVCLSDMTNAVRMSAGGKGRHLLLDDVHASWIFDIYCEFVSRGLLMTETFFDDWEDAGRNLLARIA
jgi:Methyltransferase domain